MNPAEIGAFLLAILCLAGAARASDEQARVAWQIAFVAACFVMVASGLAAILVGLMVLLVAMVGGG